MLDFETVRNIGFQVCVNRIGKDIVETNKNNATSAYSRIGNELFCFVGVDTDYKSTNGNTLTMDSLSNFAHKASCYVSFIDGSIRY